MASPRQFLTRAVLLGLLCGVGVVGLQALNGSRLSGPEAQALAALNQARAAAGTSSLAPDWRLTIAARRQASHMAETAEVAHNRTKFKGLFDFQETPEKRRLFAFYFSRGAESLAKVFTAEPAQTVSSLVHAPYHRISLLDPGATQAGVGLLPQFDNSVRRFDTAVTLGGYPATPAQTVVVWPAAGAKGIPAFFLPGTETPNPAPEAKAVGYVVTVQAATDQRLSTQSFILRHAGNGKAVPGRVATSASDPNMPEQAAAFIASQPLEWGTEYQAEYQGIAPFGEVHKSWSFHTAAAPAYALTIEGEDQKAASLHFSLTSPVQPAHICYKKSAGTSVELAWVSPEQFRLKVSACGGESCSVQVYLSNAANCVAKKARVNALFGGKAPDKAPELIGRS